MTIPSMGDIANMYRPLPAATKELRINDAWLARWSDADELPAGAPVGYVYATLYAGDKGFVIRPRGAELWATVEGELGGEEPEAWLRREVPARTGITVGKLVLIGYLECRPTRFNTEVPSDTIQVRPFYIVAASKVADVPDSSGFERRRLILNEHLTAMRNRYPEIRPHVEEAHDRYLTLRAKGEI